MTTVPQEAQDLLCAAVRSFVRNPAAVSVSVGAVDDGEVLLVIRAADDDIGRVIGRDGQHIKALRLLALSVGAQLGLRVHVGVAGSRVQAP